MTPPLRKKKTRIEKIASFGEGHYGELEWFALGAMTLGLGLLPMYITKKICQQICRAKEDA